MEFQGKIKKILPVRSGISQKTGNEWKVLPFVFEYHEHETDRYADTVVLETRDANVIEHLKEGMEVVCGFGHSTFEYEGRVFNELKLYKIQSVKPQNAAPQATKSAEPNNNPPGFERPATGDGNGDDDDLPF